MNEAERQARQGAQRVMSRKIDEAWATFRQRTAPLELARADEINSARREYEQTIAHIEEADACVSCKAPSEQLDTPTTESPREHREDEELLHPAEASGERIARLLRECKESLLKK